MPESDSVTPKVFLSYSHDSSGHKQWVAKLAAQLCDKGIDAVLDQWDLSPGEDIGLFIEKGLRSADRVLMICTSEYVRKANAGQGGVGYERMIVTAELFRDLGTKKFIAVVRDSRSPEKVPTFIGTRLYINLSDEALFDEEFDHLLRELHEVPHVDRPPVGRNPYANSNTISVGSISTGGSQKPLEIPSELTDPQVVYEVALTLARTGDVLGWRQLVKQIRSPLQMRLVAWREHYDQVPPDDQTSLLAAVNEAIEAVAPLIVVALTGVESQHSQLRDQRALFDDLYNISGWNLSGRTSLVALPDTLGFIYHSLHGAMCVNTDQLDLAFALTDMEVTDRVYRQSERMSSRHELMGWPESLGRKCLESWQFLTSGPERWPWLTKLFGSMVDFQASLSAYYMLHSLDEFALRLAAGHGPTLRNHQSKILLLDTPLCFAADDWQIQERAYKILLRNLSKLQERWRMKNVGSDLIEEYWPDWLKLSYAWLQNVFGFSRSLREPPYAHLFEKRR